MAGTGPGGYREGGQGTDYLSGQGGVTGAFQKVGEKIPGTSAYQETHPQQGGGGVGGAYERVKEAIPGTQEHRATREGGYGTTGGEYGTGTGGYTTGGQTTGYSGTGTGTGADYGTIGDTETGRVAERTEGQHYTTGGGDYGGVGGGRTVDYETGVTGGHRTGQVPGREYGTGVGSGEQYGTGERPAHVGGGEGYAGTGLGGVGGGECHHERHGEKAYTEGYGSATDYQTAGSGVTTGTEGHHGHHHVTQGGGIGGVEDPAVHGGYDGGVGTGTGTGQTGLTGTGGDYGTRATTTGTGGGYESTAVGSERTAGEAEGVGKESVGHKILKHVPGTEAHKEYKGTK